MGGPTNVASHVISGHVDVADAGTTVTIFDGTVPLGHTQVQADGSFNLDVILAGTGTHVLAAEDRMTGNRGTSNRLIFTFDATPPTVSLDCIALEHDTGVSDRDFITNDGHVTLKGHVAESLGGVLVRVFDNQHLLGVATISADGTWSLSAELGEGLHRFSATATDAGGNIARAENAQAVLVDQDPGEENSLAIRFVDTTIHNGAALQFEVSGLRADQTPPSPSSRT